MISVCIATFNGEMYIKDQLDSILEQLGDADEVVISDDGSTDNTLSIINEIADPRIKIFINQGIHGFTPNFENALMQSQGDIIFLSDQDDIWKEDKVKKSLEYLQTCDFVISDCVTVNNAMEVLQESRFKAFGIKNGFIRHLIKSRFLGCCMAFKRSVLTAALPFPAKYNLLEHDIWLAAVGMLYFKVELINEPLILYRRHGKNVSDGGFEKGYSLWNKLHRRMYRVKELIRIRKKVKKLKKVKTS